MTIKPQHLPTDSPWPLRLRIKMLLWDYVWLLFCVWTPKPTNSWRLWVLRLFGARIEGRPFVHQRARIQMPWHLTLHHGATLGDRANTYCLGDIEIGAGATIAQEAYLCAGTHDFADPAMRLVTRKIVVGPQAFVGARAFILPGISVGARAIVGAGSVVTRDVPPGAVVAGNPAKFIRMRSEAEA